MEASTSFSSHIAMQTSRTSPIQCGNTQTPHQTGDAPAELSDRHHQAPGPISLSFWRRIAISSKKRENRKLAACYWALAAAGWNDASLGPLIPYIENQYRINYTIVSTMFISQCAGYMFAGVTMNRFTDRWGMGKMLTVGACLQMLGYAVCIAPPPFPVLPCIYIFIGCGVAYQDAGANAWGYLHGAYGFGGLCSPLVATAFVQAGIKWSFFYSVSLSFAFTNVCILYMTFWRDNAPLDHEEDRSHGTDKQDQAVQSKKADPDDANISAIELERFDNAERRAHVEGHEAGFDIGSSASAPTSAAQAEVSTHRTASAKDKEIFKNRIVWISAFFLLLYVGAEVSIGGWVVSFLLDERNGPVSAGYVSSGFWGGITLGRVLLPSFNVFVGERNVVFLYIGLALALEFVIWFVKDFISNAVAVSLVGFVLGPFFPIVISVAGKLLPRYLHNGAIGLMAAVGSAGAAIFPFFTGLIAQEKGSWILQPVIVSLLVAMAALWVWIPSPARRAD